MSERTGRIVNARRIYLTTAIPYVNGAPHIGHALELVQVDALAAPGELAAMTSAHSPAPTTTP